MKISLKRFWFLLAVLIVVGGVGVWITRARPGQGTVATDSAQKKGKVLYYCPMHPTYISEQKGECPICGMTLVPVEEETHAAHEEGGEHAGHVEVEGHALVRLAPQRQQLIGVKTEIIQRRKLSRTINTVGWIAYDPDLYHTQEEYIASLEGLRRARDSTIPEIRERAEKLVASAKLRLRLLGLSEEQIEEVGHQPEPDRRLLLGDVLENVWLYASVYEYELPLVKQGDRVEVEIRAFPGKIFTGKVESIDTVLDPKTRSARVRVLIPNLERTLKPQMFANAKIHVTLGEHLAVPAQSVIDTGTRQIVFVEHREGEFMPHTVRLGPKAEGYYVVHEGLKEGDRIVTSGNFLIDSESRLRAATKAATGDHQH